MKSTQFLSMLSVLGLAASVTAGTMYVTVNAAIQQEADEVTAGQAALADAVAEVAEAMDAPLTPDNIISNRSHDIVLDADGSFSGRLSSLGRDDLSAPAAGIIVKVIQDGKSAGEAMTNDAGVFAFKGLKAGVVALLAYSGDSFLLFGVRLVEGSEQHPANGNLDVDAAVVRGSDVGLVKQIMASRLTGGDLRFNAAETQGDEEFSFGVGEVSTSVVGHRVQLQNDGTLNGVINLLDDRTGRVREILDLTVYFVKDGRMAGKSDVSNNGEFSVTGLSPGIYSVVGVGRDGTFALGVDVVGSDYEVAESTSSGSEYRTVAVMAALEMSIAPAGAGNFNSGNAPGLTGGAVNPSSSGTPGGTPSAPSPGAGGGAAGGGTGGGTAGGGGAGAGGGGGLGALIGAGIAGGVGYLAGQNDNNDTPASPGN